MLAILSCRARQKIRSNGFYGWQAFYSRILRESYESQRHRQNRSYDRRTRTRRPGVAEGIKKTAPHPTRGRAENQIRRPTGRYGFPRGGPTKSVPRRAPDTFWLRKRAGDNRSIQSFQQPVEDRTTAFHPFVGGRRPPSGVRRTPPAGEHGFFSSLASKFLKIFRKEASNRP